RRYRPMGKAQKPANSSMIPAIFKAVTPLVTISGPTTSRERSPPPSRIRACFLRGIAISIPFIPMPGAAPREVLLRLGKLRGLLEQLLQGGRAHVREPLYIDAALAPVVLAELGHERLVLRRLGRAVDDQRALA